MESLVSIIVPIYNVRNYVEKCIGSLMHQTYTNIEIILIDDGSTDGSGEICDTLAKEDSRIRIVHSLNNGVSHARNIGLDLVIGDYVTFVDGDDWLEEDWVEISLNEINMSNSDILIAGFTKSYESGEEQVMHCYSPKRKLSNIECLKEMYMKPFDETYFAWEVCAKLFLSKLWSDVRFNNDISFQEDGLAFWEVLKKANSVMYIPMYKYHYFCRSNSVVHAPTIKNIYDSYKTNEIFYKNPWYDDYDLIECMSHKYFMSRLTLLLKLALYQEEKDIFIKEQKRVYSDIYTHFRIEWKYKKIKGLIKLLVVCMPYDVVRIISSYAMKS